MNLNESIVEDAALEWSQLRHSHAGQVGEQGYAVGHGPHLAPGEATAERDSFGEMLLVGRLREVLRATGFLWYDNRGAIGLDTSFQPAQALIGAVS